MEDPQKQITEVVNLVTTAVNSEVQEAAVLKYVPQNIQTNQLNMKSHRYYSPDAGFSHPLCRVVSGPRSRDLILGILQ